MWCETAKRARKVEDHLRGCKGKELYRMTMEMLHHYHCSSGSFLAFADARANIPFEEAFVIVDVMKCDDWQLVHK